LVESRVVVIAWVSVSDVRTAATPAPQPALHQQQATNPDALLGLWQQTQKHTTAQIYSWVFVVLSTKISAVWAVLVCLRRSASSAAPI
jgi:hypothetical protein